MQSNLGNRLKTDLGWAGRGARDGGPRQRDTPGRTHTAATMFGNTFEVGTLWALAPAVPRREAAFPRAIEISRVRGPQAPGEEQALCWGPLETSGLVHSHGKHKCGKYTERWSR